METEIKAIKSELFKFCWYMRGSLSVTESYELTNEDREVLATIIEGNLETTKESGLPFF
jgi:hypothetical protein